MKFFSKKIIFGLIVIMCSVSARAQQTKILTAEKHNEYGIIYSLPITALEVEVTAEREIRKAGPYYRYAKKYAGADKVVKQDEEIWTIKTVKVKPYGIPNQKSRYLMQLKSGALTYVAVANDGMLLAVNAVPEEETSETGTTVPGDGSIKVGEKDYLQYVNEDFISAQSSAKQAQMLSEELMEIREAKVSLTRGTAETMPTDGRQLELMLNSLDRQEAALTAAFTGIIEKETVTRSYNFTPSEDSREILFRFSDFAGFTDKDDYSGEPVNIEVKVTERGELPVDSKGEEKKLPKDAVAYCVPGTALTTITYKGNTLFSKEFELAQLGVVFGLNPSIFTDKKEPSYAIFDPATGALRELGTVKD